MSALAAGDRLFFETHGYLKVEGALDASEVEQIRHAADRAEGRFRRDESLPGSRLEEFFEIEAILEFDPIFFDLAVHPKVFPGVREVIGTDVSIVDHAYYVTPPGGKLTGGAWHRDVRCPGIYHPRSTVMVRAMYALTDIGPDGGATLVLPGSHRYTDDVEIPKVEVPEEMPGHVAVTCRAGDAYFFSGNLLHAPSHNRSRATRRVVLFNYGHKWMRMWRGHEPSPWLAERARTPLRRQLLCLSGAYFGEDAELE